MLTQPLDRSLPPVLRSRRALEVEGVRFVRPGSAEPTQLPITDEGTTYTMAQEAEWLDERHFAVGRWDGTLSIFAWNPTSDGPIITKAVSDPASEGVQMIQLVNGSTFASSAGDAQLAVWSSPTGAWDAIAATLVSFDPAFGAANSAATLKTSAGLLVAVGHANGWLTVWNTMAQAPYLALARSIDLRNPDPVNPWGLHNIRGVEASPAGVASRVVTGSEDGFISVVDVVTGAIVSQTVFNVAAKRGINSIAVQDSGLLVANCSVGDGDANLWYFTVDAAGAVVLRDRANLKVDPAAPQVFNFCVTFMSGQGDGVFACSTQEGALWMGAATQGALKVLGYEQVTTPLGSALAWRAQDLVLVGYDVHEFAGTAAAR